MYCSHGCVYRPILQSIEPVDGLHVLMLLTPAGDERCESDESLIINALGQMQLLLPALSAHSHTSSSTSITPFCFAEEYKHSLN